MVSFFFFFFIVMPLITITITITTRKKLSHQGGTKHFGQKLGAVHCSAANLALQCIITIVNSAITIITIIKCMLYSQGEPAETCRKMGWKNYYWLTIESDTGVNWLLLVTTGITIESDLGVNWRSRSFEVYVPPGHESS